MSRLGGGTSARIESYICDFSLMECAWETAVPRAVSDGGVAAGRVDLPRVDSGYSRLKFHVALTAAEAALEAEGAAGGTGGGASSAERSRGAGTRALTVTRNALVAPNATVDCADFVQWAAASQACESLLRGTAGDGERDQWALLLTMPQRRASNVFHFAQLDVAVGGGGTPGSYEARKKVQREGRGANRLRPQVDRREAAAQSPRSRRAAAVQPPCSRRAAAVQPPRDRRRCRGRSTGCSASERTGQSLPGPCGRPTGRSLARWRGG